MYGYVRFLAPKSVRFDAKLIFYYKNESIFSTYILEECTVFLLVMYGISFSNVRYVRYFGSEKCSVCTVYFCIVYGICDETLSSYVRLFLTNNCTQIYKWTVFNYIYNWLYVHKISGGLHHLFMVKGKPEKIVFF